MSIRIFRFIVASLVLCAVTAASFIARGVDAILSLAPASPLLRQLFSFGPTLQFAGHPIDRALQNDLRHEAGVSRRSAARHI